MEQQTKKCPYCGEEILAVAKKCKHCGEWLEEKEEKVAVAQSPIVEPVIEKPKETEAKPTSQEKTGENRNEYPPVESYYVSGKTKFIWGAISAVFVIITIWLIISPPEIEFDYLFGTIDYAFIFFVLSILALCNFITTYDEQRKSKIFLNSNGDLDIETPRKYKPLSVSFVSKVMGRITLAGQKNLDLFNYQNGRVQIRNSKGHKIEGALKDLTFTYKMGKNKMTDEWFTYQFVISDTDGNKVQFTRHNSLFTDEEYADIEMLLSLAGTVKESKISKFTRKADSVVSAFKDLDFSHLTSSAIEKAGSFATSKITDSVGLLAKKRIYDHLSNKKKSLFQKIKDKFIIGIFIIYAIIVVCVNIAHIANASSSESENIEYYDEQGYSASDVENSEIDQFAEQPSNNEVTTTPRLLTVTKVDYSFYLKPQAGNTYEPSNMVDGNLATAWAISLDQVNYKNGKIYGPTFTIDCMKLSHVVIRNGYCKNESSYMNNTRALKVILCNAGNVDDEDETASYLYEGTLEDTSEEQVLHINSDLPCNQNIQKVQLIFPSDGLRRGNKWDDLCVTEIEFWGI